MKSLTIWDDWIKISSKNASRTAVVDLADDRTWTFREIHLRVLEMAQILEGIPKGSRIAFGGSNRSEWLVQFLAMQSKDIVVLALETGMSYTQRLVCAKQQNADYLWEGNELISTGRPKSKKKSTFVAFEKLTSGSTGVPQKIPWTHSNLMEDGRQIVSTMGIRSTDFQLGLIPLGHSYGMGSLVMPWILKGVPLALAPQFVSGQIPQWLKRWKLTTFPTVPAVLRILNESPSVESLSPLRLIISAGARLEASSAESFLKKFGVRIHNFYGSTETGGVAYDRTGLTTLTGGAIGKPLKGVTIQLNPAGRILVKSPAVATRSGKFLLSDRGCWNAKKELVLLGRVKSLVNIGGKKIDPMEIERILIAIDGIREVWIGGVEGKSREDLVVAVEGTVDESEIYRVLLKELPAWKVPKKIRVMRVLPRTVRGKIDVEKTKSLF